MDKENDDIQKEKQEIFEKIRALKIIASFHADRGMIKDPGKLDQHLNDILDAISELEDRLNALNK